MIQYQVTKFHLLLKIALKRNFEFNDSHHSTMAVFIKQKPAKSLMNDFSVLSGCLLPQKPAKTLLNGFLVLSRCLLTQKPATSLMNDFLVLSGCLLT